jgi:hypothetical protein
MLKQTLADEKRIQLEKENQRLADLKKVEDELAEKARLVKE